LDLVLDVIIFILFEEVIHGFIMFGGGIIIVFWNVRVGIFVIVLVFNELYGWLVRGIHVGFFRRVRWRFLCVISFRVRDRQIAKLMQGDVKYLERDDHPDI
jgi:hypothetical protein